MKSPTGHSPPPGLGNPADRINGAARVLGVGLSLILAVMGLRVLQLQTHPGEQLSGHISERTLSRPVYSARGDITDRRGRLISTSALGYRVVVDPVAVDIARLDETVAALAEVLELPQWEVADRIIARLDRNDAILAARSLHTATQEDMDPVSELAAVFTNVLGRGEDDWIAVDDRELASELLPEPVDAAPDPRAAQAARQLSRYVPLGTMIDRAQADAVRDLKLAGVWLETRSVRDRQTPDALAWLVGKVGQTEDGLMGLESMLDDQLRGTPGSLQYVRDAFARPLWIERGAVQPARLGAPVRSSIDLEVQRMVEEELRRGLQELDAAGGRVLVMLPATGEIIAIADHVVTRDDLTEMPWVHPDTPREQRAAINPEVKQRPRYRVLPAAPKPGTEPALVPSRAIVSAFEPGSIFKPFAWAVGHSAGVLPEDEILEFRGSTHATPYGRIINDVYPRDRLTWDEVLVHSSNRGMSIIGDRLEPAVLRDGLAAFGFGRRSGLGIEHESFGLLQPMTRWNKYTQTSVTFGQEVAITPVQAARAFSAFARQDELAGTVPNATLVAVREDHNAPGILRRAIEPETALRVRSVLATIGTNLDRKIAIERPSEPAPRYRMFGKSGTAQIPCTPPTVYERLPDGTERMVRYLRPGNAGGYFARQYISSFVGAAPLEHPEIVVLVAIEDPGPDRVRAGRFFGSDTAGPVVRRVIERVLPYLNVAPDVLPETVASRY